MAIENSGAIPQLFNPSDEAAVAVEALDILGLVEDRDQMTETLTTDFAHLKAEVDLPGEPYVQIPRNLMSLPDMVTILDNSDYAKLFREHPEETWIYPQKYHSTKVYDRLWTPKTAFGSYAATDIGNLEMGQADTSWPAHSRLALYNPDNPNEPLLHFLNKSFDGTDTFDGIPVGLGEETQLQAIAKVRERYEIISDSNLTVVPLNASAVVMLALTRRIKGQALPLEGGYMHDATLPRTILDGGGIGGLHSDQDRLWLDGASGHPAPYKGVGISLGPKKLEVSAS